MSRPIKIGILAGMGPRSTAPFLESVLDECQRQYGAMYDIDYPHMQIYSLPTPFYPNKPLNDVGMTAALKVGIDGLCMAQVDFIVVPCNTAHLYFDVMQAQSKVPVLNMIELTLAKLSLHQGGVAVLSTRQTFELGLYTKPLMAAGFEVCVDEAIQSLVDDLLLLRKTQGITAETMAVWQDVRTCFDDAGVTQVLVACTDLGFITSHASEFEVHDAGAILAAETVRHYLRISA